MNNNKNIFIFDKNKCVGCGACAVACMNENGFQLTDRWRNISNSNNQHFPGAPLFYLSLACNHCDDAPCLKNCPALAYSRDENTGAIIHHAEKCIGCKYCTWACPYDAPKYNPNMGIVEKCTFCNHRIAEGEKPACAQLCPTGALDFSFENLSTEKSLSSSPVKVDVGAHFKSIELRNSKGPEIDESLFFDVPRNMEQKLESKVSAKKEWPLVIFTLLVSALVAIVSVENELTSTISNYFLIGIGLISTVLSTLHLGKKARAWRSLLNQKNSWLSREIMSFSIFLSLIILDTFLIEIRSVVFILVGFVLLFSIDKLYELAMWKWPVKIHSAQTLFIGLSAILLLANQPHLFFIISFVRIALFVSRILVIKTKFSWVRLFRVLFLIIAIYGVYFSLNFTILIGIFTLGEIIDRIAFYNDLAVPIPANEINQ